MVNSSRKNRVSGNSVGYKLVPPATQLLLADPECIQYKRALFAQHHLWVTKYKDDELYAGGRFTLQSTGEVGGVADAVARGDNVEDDDVVVWSVFGLTHNPRVEVRRSKGSRTRLQQALISISRTGRSCRSRSTRST